MKKVLWFIVCLMTMVIGLSSCGGDIVSKARDNYKQRLTAIAKDHDVEVSFNNENILIQKNDIVVISFTANAHDKYGKYGTLDFISVYAIDENGNIGTAVDTKYNWEKLFSLAKEVSNIGDKAVSDELKELANKLKTDEDIYRYTVFYSSIDAQKSKDNLYKAINSCSRTLLNY